jgi:hypothetical protein
VECSEKLREWICENRRLEEGKLSEDKLSGWETRAMIRLQKRRKRSDMHVIQL